MAIDADPLLTKAEKTQKKQNLCIAFNLNSLAPRPSLSSPLSNSFFHNDTVESVVGKFVSQMNSSYFNTLFYFNDILNECFRKCFR